MLAGVLASAIESVGVGTQFVVFVETNPALPGLLRLCETVRSPPSPSARHQQRDCHGGSGLYPGWDVGHWQRHHQLQREHRGHRGDQGGQQEGRPVGSHHHDRLRGLQQVW